MRFHARLGSIVSVIPSEARNLGPDSATLAMVEILGRFARSEGSGQFGG